MPCPILRRFDGPPLIRPILFKTTLYFVVVFFVRVMEKIVEYLIDGGSWGAIPEYVRDHFTWHRFIAIQIWIFVLFLIYTTAVELNSLFGDGKLARILFTGDGSELMLPSRKIDPHVRRSKST